MATTIKIKSSSVVGKVPEASKLATSELALNLADRKLYSKDVDGNVFEIGGSIDSGDTPPPSGNQIGDLFWDGDFLLVWDGSDWVPANVSDLAYTPASNKGTVTNTAGSDAELPLVDATNAGLMSPDDFSKLGDMPSFTADSEEPESPTVGDIWIDTSDCPPTLNIWTDCADPDNPEWKPIGGGGSSGCVQLPVSIISNNGTELFSTLTALGGTAADATAQQSVAYAWTGAKIGTDKIIVADVEGDYTCTVTLTCTDGSILRDSDTFTIVDTYVEMTNKTAPIIAVEGTELPHSGVYTYVATAATVEGGSLPVIDKTEWFIGPDAGSLTSAGTGDTYTIKTTDTVGDSIYCKQTFKDARTNEIESELSNAIVIVERPVDVITFTAEIADDGTDNGNKVGSQLTANATDIVGGTAPVEYAYQWYANNVPEAAGTGDQKVKEIISTDIGKTITCKITVAEPDGSNPEERIAIYSKAIEAGVEIKKPEVLSPANGAGIGGAVTYNPETSAIAAGGVETTESSVVDLDSLHGGNIIEGNQAYIGTWEDLLSNDNEGSAAALIIKNVVANSMVYSYYYFAGGNLGTGGTGDPIEVTKATLTYYTNDPGGAFFFFDENTNPIPGTNIDYTQNGNLPVTTTVDIPDGYKIIGFGHTAPAALANLQTNLYKIELKGPGATKLTFTNDKAFDSADGTEKSTIDQVFKAGDKVVGEGDITVFADSPAFSTTLYDGNGDKPTNRTQFIPSGVDNTAKSLVWLKCRTDAYNNNLVDTVNGGLNYLVSNTTSPITTNNWFIQSFASNGFTIGSAQPINFDGESFVAWNFRGAPGFFDVVTYEGDNGNNVTVPHSLGSVPGMIIVKGLQHNSQWYVYHKEAGLNYAFYLNDTVGGSNALYNGEMWGNTEPTATEFTVNSSASYLENDFVAYLFADTPGLIKCGKAPGAGAVDIGFKPGWLMFKADTQNSDWVIVDLTRDGTNPTTQRGRLNANKTDAEEATYAFQFTDTGWTQNWLSNSYIYVAIAENAQAGQFLPTGVLTEDADASGPSMTLTDVMGEWKPGLTAVNQTEVTEHAPGADEIVFTSSKPATDSGTVNIWGAAEWELSTDSGFVTKQEASVQLQNIDVEQGPTSFTLEGDTEYWVHTRYSSLDPAAGPSEWSDANKFKTAGGGGGAYGNFSTTLYDGNNTDGRFEETGIDNTGKSLVWIKHREASQYHALFSNQYGLKVDLYYGLTSNDAKSIDGLKNNVNGIREFKSNGIVLNKNGAVNTGASKYVAWNFAAAEGFFDVVTYESDGFQENAPTVPHSLGSEPGMIIIKSVDTSSQWFVYHKGLGKDKHILLNSSAAQDNEVPDWEMSANTFKPCLSSIATSEFVAYLFADNPDGGIKCGSFDSGADSTAVNVDVGFKPGWLLVKGTKNDDETWNIYDKARGFTTDRFANPVLLANESFAEFNDNRPALTDTGFTFVAANTNETYIYVAIADNTVRFYDEKALKTVTNHTLTKRYGVDPLKTDLRKHGIYPLTEQPTYSVDTFVREGDAYKPVRDYTSELSRAQQDAAEANARLDERDDQIRHLKVEVAKAAALEKVTTAIEERLAALEAKNEDD